MYLLSAVFICLFLVISRSIVTICSLDNGTLIAQDEMANELFPTRFKKNHNATYVKCKMCGQETDEDRAVNGYCETCLNTGETYRCSECGCEMIYTNYQKLIKQSRRHDICRDCNDKNNSVYTTIICSNCDHPFEITYGEKKFYDKKGFDLPKKCSECRSNSNSGYAYTSSQRNTTDSTFSTSKKKKSGGLCFVTTAVCEYFNKPDDCYELTTLRSFRDNWLIVQTKGDNLIKEYYDIAPKIVEILNLRSDKDIIYNNLWLNYISPCIKLIELTAYQSCRDLYVEMITNLKNSYIKEQ
ncbi:MAG: zinc-ribbon domain-containing protein [Oscillospiraceae bacterium]|nr:zinc-ribbon domain-containing protein [Oscillospiraceae bacterium]